MSAIPPIDLHQVDDNPLIEGLERLPGKRLLFMRLVERSSSR